MFKSYLYLPLLCALIGAPSLYAAPEKTDNTPPSENAMSEGDVSNNDASKKDSTENDASNNESPNNASPQRLAPNPDASTQKSLHTHLTQIGLGDEWVTIGDGDRSFNALLREEASGTPQGALVILHDNEQHQHWPSSSAPVRTLMPEYGWQTFSVPLPRAPKNFQPHLSQVSQAAKGTEKGGDNKEQNSETRSEPSADFSQTQKNYLTEVQGRIKQSLNYLADKGQLNIAIIAYGQTAKKVIAISANQSADQKDKTGFGLILIDMPAFEGNGEHSAKAVMEQFAELDIPILEISTQDRSDFSNPTARAADARARIMKHNKREQYQQRTLLNSHDQAQGERLARLIRGWLKTHLKGEAATVK